MGTCGSGAKTLCTQIIKTHRPMVRHGKVMTRTIASCAAVHGAVIRNSYVLPTVALTSHPNEPIPSASALLEPSCFPLPNLISSEARSSSWSRSPTFPEHIGTIGLRATSEGSPAVLEEGCQFSGSL